MGFGHSNAMLGVRRTARRCGTTTLPTTWEEVGHGFPELWCCSKNLHGVPSGKQPHNYGKSPFLMGKLTINGHFQ